MPKRHALLVAYLLFSGQQLRDELATMYIRVVGRWFNKADKRHWQHFQSNGRAINRKLHGFMRLSKALLQARAQMRDLGGAGAATIGWERLAEGVEETEELAVPPISVISTSSGRSTVRFDSSLPSCSEPSNSEVFRA